MLLVLLDTLVEFDAFVALKFQTLSANVYAQYQLGFSAAGAAALSLILDARSAWSSCSGIPAQRRRQLHANQPRSTTRRDPLSDSAGRCRWRSPGWALLVAVSLGIPLGSARALVRAGQQTAGAPAGAGSLWSATRDHVLLGVAAGLVALLLALPVAILAVRRSGRFVTAIERSVYLSFALPDLVAAIALAYGATHVAHFLYGTVVLLVLAEAMLFVPFAVVALRGTIGLIEPSLEESGRALGLGPLRTLWRVTVAARATRAGGGRGAGVRVRAG